MSANGIRVALLLTFCVAVAATLAVRQSQLAGLRDTAARSRPANGELDRLRAEHDRLASLQRSPAAQLESLRADHAAVARLKNEIAAVQRSLDARTRPEGARAQAATEAVPTLLDHELTREQWRNAGCATPAAAVETMLWAAAGGDVQNVRAALALTTGARAKADALLASLPAEIRDGYGSADDLVALLTARQVPLGSASVIAEVPFPEGTILVTNLKDFYGNPRVVALSLRTDGNTWRIDVPPSAIDRYAAIIRDNPNSLPLSPVGVH